jgi:hypothetical protein
MTGGTDLFDFFVYNEIFDEPNGLTKRDGKRDGARAYKNSTTSGTDEEKRDTENAQIKFSTCRGLASTPAIPLTRRRTPYNQL